LSPSIRRPFGMPAAAVSRQGALVAIIVLALIALILAIVACTLPYWHLQNGGLYPQTNAGLWQYCVTLPGAVSDATSSECYDWGILTDSTCQAYLTGGQVLSLIGLSLFLLIACLAAVALKFAVVGLSISCVALLAFGCTLTCWTMWLALSNQTCATTGSIITAPLNWYSSSFILQCIVSGLALILCCLGIGLQTIYVREKKLRLKREETDKQAVCAFPLPSAPPQPSAPVLPPPPPSLPPPQRPLSPPPPIALEPPQETPPPRRPKEPIQRPVAESEPEAEEEAQFRRDSYQANGHPPPPPFPGGSHYGPPLPQLQQNPYAPRVSYYYHVPTGPTYGASTFDFPHGSGQPPRPPPLTLSHATAPYPHYTAGASQPLYSSPTAPMVYVSPATAFSPPPYSQF
jgi:hypothetical protein